jgi:hypothetical protein
MMTPRIRPNGSPEAGQGLLEYVLILAPLSVLVALGVLAVIMAGSA